MCRCVLRSPGYQADSYAYSIYSAWGTRNRAGMCLPKVPAPFRAGTIGNTVAIRSCDEESSSRAKLESSDTIKPALFCFCFSTLLLSSFWTSRGHRCRPLSPLGSFLQFLSRIGFSNPTTRRFFIEWVLLTHTLSRFPQVSLCTRKSPHECIRVCTRGASNSRNSVRK